MHTLCLKSDLINVQVALAIGGRNIQFSHQDYESFWVNDDLAGKVRKSSWKGSSAPWMTDLFLTPSRKMSGNKDCEFGLPDRIL